MQILIQTVYGEILIGEIVDVLPPFNFPNGIWLRRKTHMSFIANEDITLKRKATNFDREVTRK